MSAQGTTGDLVGTISDPSGSVIPNVPLTVENLATHEIRTTISSSQGDFDFALLPSGHYRLTVEVPGFKKYVVPDVGLAAGDRARANVKLETGSTSQSVQVSDVAPALDTDTSTVGEAITGRTVQDLPLNGRNFVDMVKLTPGVTEAQPSALSGGTRPDDRRPNSAFAANGQSDSMNNYMIDGTDNNERTIATIGVRPSIDAIAEFRVDTNLYSAEYSRTAGAVVNVITKSGGNQLHGTVFEFFRNDALNARNFFTPTNQRKPEYRQNQYGASIGGPIRKDKTFFFGDYEGIRSVIGGVNTLTVPTLFEEQNPGNFTDLKGGTALTSGQISPIAAKYFALYPTPTNSGAANNFVDSTNKTTDSSTADVRVDHRWNGSNFSFIRYTLNQAQVNLPSELPVVNGISPGGNIGAFDGSSIDWAHNIQINHVHVFNPNLLFEGKASYTRINLNSLPLNYGQNVSQEFGLTGVNYSLATSGLAPMYIVGYASVGDGYDIPLQHLDNTFQLNGAVTWNRGRHSVKAGAVVIRRFTENQQDKPGMGFFEFVATSATPVLEDFMEGSYYSVLRNNQVIVPTFETWEPSVYVQDDWRVNSRLTLNFGVRYDVFTPFTEKKNRISNFDPARGVMIVAGGADGGVSTGNTAGVSTDYGDLAPRLGFAATIGRGLVVRGGYGISFFPTNYANNATLQNGPYIASYTALFGNLATGLPATLVPQSPTAPTGSITAVALDYKNGYLYQFNLGVEKKLGTNVLGLTYVGEYGGNLGQMIPNLDVPAPSANPVTAASRPFYATVPGVTTVLYLQSHGVSNYNAGELTLERRFTRGLAMHFSYTIAHGINDVTNVSTGTGGNGYGEVPSDIAENDRGNSDLDIRDRVVATFNYELPFANNLTGIGPRLLGGWQTNGIFVWDTDLPFTVLNSSDLSNQGGAADRPNLVGNGNLSNPSVADWFNIAAFVPQTKGTIGTSPRNVLYGPHQRHFDFSLFKNINLTERLQAEFRTEVFNLSNTPSFSEPNATLDSPATGTISSTSLDPREIQFAFKLKF